MAASNKNARIPNAIFNHRGIVFSNANTEPCEPETQTVSQNRRAFIAPKERQSRISLKEISPYAFVKLVSKVTAGKANAATVPTVTAGGTCPRISASELNHSNGSVSPFPLPPHTSSFAHGKPGNTRYCIGMAWSPARKRTPRTLIVAAPVTLSALLASNWRATM
jgi:hypothetical protein